ncbi:MAG: response regulator transcription factor [Bacteroidales bacterium]|nr:response regulator transcription factor [Bacteroidales bacterium]
MARILVVEDDFMMLKTVEHRMKNEGHEVIQAKDGQEASKLIQQQGATIDLIITDLLMPFMSGLELINLIRVEYQMKTPIIVLSKVGNEDTVLQAFELGADDYLTKPFSPNELFIRVRKQLIKR